MWTQQSQKGESGLGFTEITEETFGLMFQLGEMGTFIVPISISDEAYENHSKELSRIKTKNYSSDVNLVNYIHGSADMNILIDDLSSAPVANYGVETSEDLFYSLMENPALFDELTRDLLEEYQKYTH